MQADHAECFPRVSQLLPFVGSGDRPPQGQIFLDHRVGESITWQNATGKLSSPGTGDDNERMSADLKYLFCHIHLLPVHKPPICPYYLVIRKTLVVDGDLGITLVVPFWTDHTKSVSHRCVVRPVHVTALWSDQREE